MGEPNGLPHCIWGPEWTVAVENVPLRLTVILPVLESSLHDERPRGGPTTEQDATVSWIARSHAQETT